MTWRADMKIHVVASRLDHDYSVDGLPPGYEDVHWGPDGKRADAAAVTRVRKVARRARKVQ